MKKLSQIEKVSNNLVKAFLKNKIIAPIPSKFVKNSKVSEQLRKLCESKIKKPVIGFKAGGTGIPVLKKLGEKEPFYASVFKHNFLKNGQSIKIHKYTLGIELEVCYLIKKTLFAAKGKITLQNIKKYISHIAPCIEVVGYRQRKKGIKYLGDLNSDFGANMKFIIGAKKKYRNQNVKNLITKLTSKKNNQSVIGNTNTVYINPLNSLRFVLNKLKKDKINLNKSFYVFTGSTVGVVPINTKGFYLGNIQKLGSVKTKIL